MRRKIAVGWLALTGLAGLFLLAVWLTQPTGDPFWALAKALTADFALASPAIRYLRRN